MTNTIFDGCGKVVDSNLSPSGGRYVLKAMRPSIEHPRSNPEAITDVNMKLRCLWLDPAGLPNCGIDS